MNILLINTKSAQRTDLEEFFLEYGLHPLFADSPQEAFSLLNRSEIQFVLIDFSNSLDTRILQYINGNYPDTEVILTADSDNRDTISILKTAKYEILDESRRLFRLKEILDAQAKKVLTDNHE